MAFKANKGQPRQSILFYIYESRMIFFHNVKNGEMKICQIT